MRVILLPLLLGHALGDFYLQTDMIAKEKTQRLGTLFLHLLIYATAMAAVLFICIQESTMLVVVWALASVVHGAIDFMKFAALKNQKKGSFVHTIERNSFFIDQILHFIVMITIAMWFQGKLLACPWQPVSLTIEEFFSATGLRKVFGASYEDAANSQVRAGKIIGMLERFVAFLLILGGQYAAIGFLMTAKTITRFKDLENREIAEYYLIGTLLSIASVFCMAVICK